MSNPKILESKTVLGVVNHRVVTWTFIKLCAAYKYVGLLV